MANSALKVVLPDPRVNPTIALQQAGSLLGMGRSKTYELARNGQFPVPVLKLGCTYRVPTAPLLIELGLGQIFLSESEDHES